MKHIFGFLLFFYSLPSFGVWGPAAYSQTCFSPVEMAALFSKPRKKKSKTKSLKKLKREYRSLERQITLKENKLEDIKSRLADSLKGGARKGTRIANKIEEYMSGKYDGWECSKGVRGAHNSIPSGFDILEFLFSNFDEEEKAKSPVSIKTEQKPQESASLFEKNTFLTWFIPLAEAQTGVAQSKTVKRRDCKTDEGWEWKGDPNAGEEKRGLCVKGDDEATAGVSPSPCRIGQSLSDGCKCEGVEENGRCWSKACKTQEGEKRNPANGECEVAECTREGQKINAGANSCICKKVEENGKCWSKACKTQEGEKRNPANGECEVAECTREGQKINAGANSCICKKVEENGKCWSKACKTQEGEKRNPANGECEVAECTREGQKINAGANSCICKKVEENGKCWSKACKNARGRKKGTLLMGNVK